MEWLIQWRDLAFQPAILQKLQKHRFRKQDSVEPSFCKIGDQIIAVVHNSEINANLVLREKMGPAGRLNPDFATCNIIRACEFAQGFQAREHGRPGPFDRQCEIHSGPLGVANRGLRQHVIAPRLWAAFPFFPGERFKP